MKARNLTLCAGMCLGMAGVAFAGDRPQLQTLDAGQYVQPVRYAPVALVDGQVRQVGEWRDVKSIGNSNSAPTRSYGFLYDCYDAADDGFPQNGELCSGPWGTLQPTSRWFFGTGFILASSVNDMSVDAGNEGAHATDAGWAWSWNPPFATQCYFILLTSNDHISQMCNDPISDADGWAFDYGVLEAGAGGYYYSTFDFGQGSPDGWTMPVSGDGAVYHIISDNDFFWPVTGFGTQSMLWGTGDAGGGPGRAGFQDLQQHDDDDASGTFEMPDECFFYDLAVCPDPVGTMNFFRGESEGGEDCYVDCNGDTVINTQDFLCYLNLFVSGDPAADCNGDTVVNTQDFLCFLNLFVDPPCP